MVVSSIGNLDYKRFQSIYNSQDSKIPTTLDTFLEDYHVTEAEY